VGSWRLLPACGACVVAVDAAAVVVLVVAASAGLVLSCHWWCVLHRRVLMYRL
jgi:hypothetical protein